MMKTTRVVIVALSVILVTLLAWPALAQGETIEQVSVNRDGEQAANGESDAPSIDADGSVVAFSSTATDLVQGITWHINPNSLSGESFANIYVRYLLTGVTQLVSVNETGDEGADGHCGRPSINADGTVVAFESLATNLVSNTDNNSVSDVFVRDLGTGGSTELVSVTGAGVAANGGSNAPSINADGTVVAFESHATNLVSNPDTNGLSDVFVRNLGTGGSTQMVSVTPELEAGDGESGSPSISGDGTVVAFGSNATNLVAEDTDPDKDVFVRDLEANSTELVSFTGGGVAADAKNMLPSINADGSIVAFMSVRDVTSDAWEVFVRDRNANSTELVSVHSAGIGIVGYSWDPSINADGQRVAFLSGVPDHESPSGFAMVNVFVRDRTAKATKLLSVGWDGTEANGWSFAPSISADGQRVAFMSEATNLTKTLDLN
ncbi:MAG: TolB family protein, partial [Planctomycetota bacterium]